MNTVAWSILPAERRLLYSPIGLRLIDDFTGARPVDPIRVHLDARDSHGNWVETRVRAIRTPSDVWTYPGIGRSAQPAVQPVRPYRARVRADHYRPEYQINLDGVVFDVHPYDDDTPPVVVPVAPQNLFLLPSANYPYPRHVRVLRGVVEDNNGDPVADVEITEGPRERVLSDERGAFSLPLRWPGLNAAVAIDALDHRTGRSGQININLPGDLAGGHTITIS